MEPLALGTSQGVLLTLRDSAALVEIVNGNQHRLDVKGARAPGPSGREPVVRRHAGVLVEVRGGGPHSSWGKQRAGHVDWARPASDDPRIEQIRRWIHRWKGAHSNCSDVAVISEGRTWNNQGGTWRGKNQMHYVP